jgi:hypothetical protein
VREYQLTTSRCSTLQRRVGRGAAAGLREILMNPWDRGRPARRHRDGELPAVPACNSRFAVSLLSEPPACTTMAVRPKRRWPAADRIGHRTSPSMQWPSVQSRDSRGRGR